MTAKALGLTIPYNLLARRSGDRMNCGMSAHLASFAASQYFVRCSPIADIRRRLVQVGFWLRVYEFTP
jgi:hypothetical protein